MEKANRYIKPFNGERYKMWRTRMEYLLKELKIKNVLDTQPPTTLTDECEQAENTAKSVIVAHLADSLLHLAKPEESAKEMMSRLDAIYARKSLASEMAIRKRMLTFKLRGDTSLLKHFSYLDELFEDFLAVGGTLSKKDKVAHMLLTLPNTYDNIVTVIEQLSLDQLTLADIKPKLLDFETKRRQELQDTSSKVLQVELQKDRSYNSRPQNHHQNKMKNPRKFVKCYNCGIRGHVMTNCFFKKNNKPKPTGPKGSTAHAAEAEEPREANAVSSFAFMAGDHLLETKINNISFILDSGATDHITNRADLATNFQQLMTPIKIAVAKNNHYIMATKQGNLEVTSDQGITGVLENVLYCPEITNNLLSVSKMQAAGYTIIFDENGVKVSKEGQQLADIFTKPLPGPKFVELRNQLNIE